MKALMEWFICMERMSGDIYKKAAEIFREDKVLAPYLAHLAKDEEWHAQVMSKALEALSDEAASASIIELDNADKTKLEAPIHEMKKNITQGALSKDDLLDCIVTTEFSEYNHLFLYVINSLKESNQEIAFAASKMEHHKQSIERYFESLPNGRKYISRIRNLPKVWDTTILVVEDFAPIRTLLADILSTEGNMETTESGNKGLEKITKKFYDLIVTNMTTPEMSGIEFYKQAVRHDPLVVDRFLFLMNTSMKDHYAFVKEHAIDYIEKPFSVDHIRKVVSDILTRLPQKSHLRI
jgi:CheY-like chemotaxis protein